jgi:phage terminase large subunit-like protein
LFAVAPNVVDAYAAAVVAGTVPAGKYHRLACARHERDRAREGTPEFPYRFDIHLAERFFRFASKMRHYKGRQWAGQTVTLSDCQQFRLGSLFGWVHVETGVRRFRTHYDELPRKQGKSLEASIVVNYATFFDGEAGAEGYTSATKRDQAKIVFADAKKLVEKNPSLKRRIAVHAWNLSQAKTSSKIEPLSADHDSMDGLNPHVVVIDEFHAHKDRGIIDVLETAMGARLQPIMFQITTAGSDPISPCGDQHDYACKILDGLLIDETFFAFIAHADPEDDWLDERTWQKANPHYGISVRPEDMRALATKAKNMPAAAAAFKQKRLNLWVNTSAPWLSVDGWRRGQTAWTVESMRGETCWLTIDLSSKIDLTAVVLTFPPTDTRKAWRYLVWCLTPEDTLQERAHRDRAPYLLWKDGGYLQTNPGNRIDQDKVLAMVHEADDLFDVQQVGVDPWNAGNLVTDLTEDGFQVIEIPQTLQHMSGPSKDFEADVLDGIADAGGNPLMAWCISNVVVQRDGKDNIYPVKKRSRGRIDPVIAALMGRKLAAMDMETKPEYQLLILGGSKG